MKKTLHYIFKLHESKAAEEGYCEINTYAVCTVYF